MADSRKRKRPYGTRYAPQRAKKTFRSSRYAASYPVFPTGFKGGRGSISETKVADTDPAAYACDTTGSVTLLNGIATGTDYTDRVGRKVVIKSIYLRGFVLPVDTSTSNNLSRLILVYDKQPNGAAPAVTDILKSSTAQSQLNINNRDRFMILMDKQYAMGAYDATTGYIGSPSVQQVKKYKKCNLETIYGGTLSTIASINTGALYLVTIGSAAAAAGGEFRGSVRVRFVDS